MRITEKMGLVYTALFLTVSVAVITQNSDALMAAFRGGSTVRAVDDIFTVNAGRDQRLFVLQNDVNAGQVNSDRLQLVSQPACGSVTKTGGSFKYTRSITCSGNQKFSYCLKLGQSCDVALVTLRLVRMRAPVDSIANGPITDLSGLDTQIEINNAGLEITNVRLGRSAPSETTLAPASGARLANVSIEAAPVISMATPALGSDTVSGVFSMSASTGFGEAGGFAEVGGKLDQQISAVSRAVANPAHMIKQPPEAVHPLPADPLFAMNFGSGEHGLSLTDRMVRADTGFRAPTVMPGIDASPFGTPCVNSVSTSPAPDAMVRVLLTAACLPNSRIEIRHSKMTFAINTGHSGTLDILVPAFEENARFSFVLVDGTVMRSTVRVPGIKLMDRVAVQWRDGFDVRLTVLEFGKRWAPDRLSPESFAQLRGKTAAAPQGYLVHLGDPSVRRPIQIVVYTFPRTTNSRPGLIELGLMARATTSTCGSSRVIHSYRSRGGRLVGASGLRFKLPDCGTGEQTIVLKNAVRGLIIAAN